MWYFKKAGEKINKISKNILPEKLLPSDKPTSATQELVRNIISHKNKILPVNQMS